LSNFEGSEKLDLKDLTAKIDIKLDLSRFAFNFNAENLLENIESQDETLIRTKSMLCIWMGKFRIID